MFTHNLKTWPQYFQAVWDGSKTFEIRQNDRGYQTHDMVRLIEWIPEPGFKWIKGTFLTPAHAQHLPHLTGRLILGQITYVASALGMKEGFVVLAIKVLRKDEEQDREILNGFLRKGGS